jgi:hypothetical protein
MTVFKQNAHKRILCGLLMMTQAVLTPSSTSSAVTRLRGRKSRISVPDKALEDVYATICAIFRQHDKAALLLLSYNNIEDLVLPYIVLDMITFQFKVSAERDIWNNPEEFKSLDTDTYRTRTHPVFLTPIDDMDPVQKVKDDECRDLAVFILEDIERSRKLISEKIFVT